jgi:hypothetical protein
MEILEVLLQVLAILGLRDPIDADRRVGAESAIRSPQRIHVQVVRQRE